MKKPSIWQKFKWWLEDHKALTAVIVFLAGFLGVKMTISAYNKKALGEFIDDQKELQDRKDRTVYDRQTGCYYHLDKPLSTDEVSEMKSAMDSGMSKLDWLKSHNKL